MALKEELQQSGVWLFRCRSYLPLLLAVIFLAALRDYHYPYGSHALNRLWELFCLSVAFAGLGIRVYTIGHVPFGTSGRNTKGQVASVLNTTGIYSIVRHPLYLGNFLIWLGVSLFPRVWWCSVIIVLIFWLYYERIMLAEEDFLERKFGESFIQWAAKTPAFIPRFRNWLRPELPFSWKHAVKREYSAFFAIIAVFSVLDLVGALILHGRLALDWIWVIIFFSGLMIYLTLRFLKKRTTWLNVEGR
jgi:protein-S-isoprenylcysteine O-methyltransferase Ste14